jgi:polyhydroxybutyrate depolymerase
MERLKWMAILMFILGYILKIEHLPGASYSLLLAALLGIIYCAKSSANFSFKAYCSHVKGVVGNLAAPIFNFIFSINFLYYCSMNKLLLILLCVPLIGFGQQTLNKSIVHDNLQRDYIIHIPNSYNSNIPIPLVFCFHGYTSYASTIMSYTNFNFVSDTAGFIIVYPQGTLLQGSTHWNVGGWTIGSTADDIGFSISLLDSISNEYNIDITRVYSTGMSNGGYMSFLLACQMSDKIAAIASITGSMTPQTSNVCNPQHPTPVLQIHGTNDLTVPYLGDPAWTESIDDVLQYWVDYNNCNTSPVITPIPDNNIFDGSTAEYIVYDGGDNYVTAEHFKIYGGGHDWPGAWGNMDINASAEIWKFFSKYDINGLIGINTYISDKAVNENRLVKIMDLLGREVLSESNTPLFHIYSDGAVERRIIIE